MTLRWGIAATGNIARTFANALAGSSTSELTAVASRDVGPITIGAKVRYATGFPRTPVVGAFYESRGDRFQPLFGEHNSVRIPALFQLDLRVEYATETPIGALSLSLDVQNVTAHDNVEEIAYSYDFTARRDMPGLPTLAVVGARLDF